MQTQQLGIGVIGVGGRGALAGLAHRPEQGWTIRGGADVNDAALARFKERYGPDVHVTHDYAGLLRRDDIHAVFITSPDYCHEEQAVAALEAGKAVYLEKPMAITLAGCDQVLATAARTGARLYLGHNMRHMSFVIKMRELIEAGAIGEVKAGWCRHFIGYGGDAYFKDWHSERRYATGLLLQKGAHDIDVLHYLCGGYTRRVTAMGALTVYDQVRARRGADEPGDPTFRDENWPPLEQTGLSPEIDVEDLSMMLMELDNGVWCSYQQCHFSPDAWRNYTIIGTEGRIENLGDDPPNCAIRVWNQRTGYKEAGDIAYPMAATQGTHGGADTRIVDEFLRYARNGGSVRTSPIAARNSVAAGFLATESLREGGAPRDVPPVDPRVLAHFEPVDAAAAC